MISVKIAYCELQLINSKGRQRLYHLTIISPMIVIEVGFIRSKEDIAIYLAAMSWNTSWCLLYYDRQWSNDDLFNDVIIRSTTLSFIDGHVHFMVFLDVTVCENLCFTWYVRVNLVLNKRLNMRAVVKSIELIAMIHINSPLTSGGIVRWFRWFTGGG